MVKVLIPKRTLLFILPGIIVFILLVTVLKDLTNAIIVRPSLVSIRYLSQLLRMVNQEIVWISFLIVFSAIVLISLFAFTRKQKIIGDETKLDFSRVSYWRGHVADYSKGDYLKLRFGQRFSSLLIHALSMKYNLPIEYFSDHGRLSDIQLPEDIVDYLEITSQPFARIGIEQLKKGYDRNKVKINKEILETITPEMITKYLENELLVSPAEQQSEHYG